MGSQITKGDKKIESETVDSQNQGWLQLLRSSQTILKPHPSSIFESLSLNLTQISCLNLKLQNALSKSTNIRANNYYNVL